MKYGIIVMRAQPFHAGHQHIIDKIAKDGLQPVVILGSANESKTKRNPYNVQARKDMIHLVYPSILIGAVKDYKTYDDWLLALTVTIEFVTKDVLEESTIYLHEKLEDLENFTFRGKDYTNTSYCKMYELEGLATVSLPISDIQIRAKAIRENLEGNKQYLNKKVYKYIKGL